MDRYVLKIKAYSDDEVLRNYEEGKNLLGDLLKEMETCLGVDREIDRNDVKSYLDENLRKLIQDNLKRVR